MRPKVPDLDGLSPAWTRAAAWAGLAGVALGGLLLALRAYTVFSFAEPMQLTTGGAEEEVLFALWKVAHGLPVYADPNRIPFAASYYNWAFFFVFGQLTAAVLNLVGAGDAWLPTVVRLVALAVCAGGAFLLLRLLLLVVAPANGALKIIAIAFSVNFFFGPLAGFWTIAANVEFIACAMLLLSFYVFCRWYDERPLLAVLLFCATAYLAWAMKQYYVFSAGGVGLFLLFRRDWRMLGLLVVLLPAAWALTLYFGSDAYVKTAFFRDTDLTMSIARLARNLANMAVKSAPLLFGLIALACVMFRSRDVREAVATARWFNFFSMSLGVSLVITLPLSSFVGASENYYFAPVAILTVLLVCGMTALNRHRAAYRIVLAAVTAGWVVHSAAIALVLGGYAGVIDKRPQHERYLAVKRCLDQLSPPVFIPNDYNMLPWMHPPGPHFVLNYNYERDRKAGRPFERDGIGGLIAEGYFGALLLPRTGGNFDGAALTPFYDPRGTCADLEVWVRRDLSAPRR